MDKKPIDNIKEDILFIKVKVVNIENNIKDLKDLFNDMKSQTQSIIESIELKELHDKRIELNNKIGGSKGWFW